MCLDWVEIWLFTVIRLIVFTVGCAHSGRHGCPCSDCGWRWAVTVTPSSRLSQAVVSVGAVEVVSLGVWACPIENAITNNKIKNCFIFFTFIIERRNLPLNAATEHDFFQKTWFKSRFLRKTIYFKRENLVTHARCVYLFTFFLFVAANAIDDGEWGAGIVHPEL